MHLKIETYSAPIAGPDPSGVDLRYSPIYDQIKEAKRADDQLDRGEWHTDLKREDWSLVGKLCGEALKEKSKDLQITAWFTEALLHQYGFEGLEFGIRLMVKLMTDFWESLYPAIEDGDLDYRIGPMTYLNEKLPTAVCQVPLCDPERTRGFNYFDREASRQVGFDSGLDQDQKVRRQELIDEGKITGEEFASAVNLSPLLFYKTRYLHLEACGDQLRRLDEVVNERFAPDPPGFTMLTDALGACTRAVKKIYDEKRKSEVDLIDDDETTIDSNGELANAFADMDEIGEEESAGNPFSRQNAISDISGDERAIWKAVAGKAGNGHLKNALDQLMAAAALAPSVRQKNRYLLLVAKLCLRAGRYDLAKPIAEQLYELIESLHLEKWEHPAWIADVIETLYRCLEQESDGSSERAAVLFQKLCTLNITKAATYRLAGAEP